MLDECSVLFYREKTYVLFAISLKLNMIELGWPKYSTELEKKAIDRFHIFVYLYIAAISVCVN